MPIYKVKVRHVAIETLTVAADSADNAEAHVNALIAEGALDPLSMTAGGWEVGEPVQADCDRHEWYFVGSNKFQCRNCGITSTGMPT